MDVKLHHRVIPFCLSFFFICGWHLVSQDCLKLKNCSHNLCRQTPKGPECLCKTGYLLDSDGVSCNGKSKNQFFLLSVSFMQCATIMALVKEWEWKLIILLLCVSKGKKYKKKNKMAMIQWFIVDILVSDLSN